MMIFARSYHSSPGTRELCHKIKESKSEEDVAKAAEEMASFIVSANAIPERSAFIPAPQRSGKAGYTLVLAGKIAEKTGGFVADILGREPGLSIYEERKAGRMAGLRLFLEAPVPDARHLFFVDNVLCEGRTFLAARDLVGERLLPLVYAVDEEMSGIAGALSSSNIELVVLGKHIHH